MRKQRVEEEEAEEERRRGKGGVGQFREEVEIPGREDFVKGR